jgi:hypothetical protein
MARIQAQGGVRELATQAGPNRYVIRGAGDCGLPVESKHYLPLAFVS